MSYLVTGHCYQQNNNTGSMCYCIPNNFPLSPILPDGPASCLMIPGKLCVGDGGEKFNKTVSLYLLNYCRVLSSSSRHSHLNIMAAVVDDRNLQGTGCLVSPGTS